MYCSPKCQKKDWSIHKVLCQPMANLIKPTEPSYRALFLPADGTGPTLVWLEKSKYGEEGQFEPYLEAEDSCFGLATTFQNQRRSRMFHYKILSINHPPVKPSALSDMPVNKSIEKLTCTIVAKSWRGSFMIISKRLPLSLGSLAEPIDFTLHDFKDLVDVLEHTAA
ncbi:hypothetical protein MMC25_001244 [Agyrium rufum]|nr:hypothetical protein [Agyrium rufum]